MLAKKCCIYKIQNIVTGKFYIGSSININRRWYEHKKSLRNNDHGNKYLQRCWNKYKEENFIFKIVEFCSKKDIIKIEQKWLDKTKCYNNKIGYNMSRIALGISLSGKDNPRYGKEPWNLGKTFKNTEEAKRNKSLSAEHREAVKRELGIKTKHTNKAKKKISKALKKHVKSGVLFNSKHRSNLCKNHVPYEGKTYILKRGNKITNTIKGLRSYCKENNISYFSIYDAFRSERMIISGKHKGCRVYLKQ